MLGAEGHRVSIGKLLTVALTFLVVLVTLTDICKETLETLPSIYAVETCENEGENKPYEPELELEDTYLTHHPVSLEIYSPLTRKLYFCSHSHFQNPFESITSPPPEG